MAYVPDPSDDTNPLDSTKARTAAAEFRAIKQFITKIPQKNISAARTFDITDAGHRIYHPSTDVTPRVWTIPASSTVDYPLGTVISVLNGNAAGDVTLTAAVGVTLRRMGNDAEGARVLPPNAGGHLEKVDTDLWYLSATGDT